MAYTSIDTGITTRHYESAAETADGTHIPALAHELSDTALALLLCYAAEGHCRFTYDPSDRGSGSEGKEAPEDVVTAGLLAAEVAKVATSTFGFEARIFDLRECSTVEDAAVAMGVAIGKTILPEMVVVTGMAEAKQEIRGFMVEVMRTRRIELRRGGWVRAGEWFMVIDVTAKRVGERKGISRHMTDFFFISHHHAPTVDEVVSDASSFASVVRKPLSSMSNSQSPFVSPEMITLLRDLAKDVSIATEIRRYMHDLVVFLRMHRAVRSGCVSSRATKDFETLVRCLAVIHGLDFATPALVTLALFKVYNHRLEILEKAERERSVLYGSDKETVARYLKGIEPEMVVSDVVENVRAPL